MAVRLFSSLFPLLLALATFAQIPRATPLVDVPFEPEHAFETFDGAFVHDDAASYLGTPGGLYRLPRTIVRGSTAELLAFPRRAIHNLYVRDGALYVLKNGLESRGTAASDHTFLRSRDRGATFQPLDAALEACAGGYCAFMTPTQAQFRGDAIFLNAGSNFLATRDDGATWVPLVGALEPLACYHPTFTVIGERVLIGGECPLDTAYVRSGTLRAGALQWEREPADVIAPELENRNVQFIARVGDSSVVFAGIEGALLRSSDLGASFDYVIHQVQGVSPKYAYIGLFLAPSQRPDVLLVAGFDKAVGAPYLAYSRDDGRTWEDRSDAVTFADANFSAVVFLTEDAQGRILAGVQSWEGKRIRIVEIDFVAAPKRRAVRW